MANIYHTSSSSSYSPPPEQTDDISLLLRQILFKSSSSSSSSSSPFPGPKQMKCEIQQQQPPVHSSGLSVPTLSSNAAANIPLKVTGNVISSSVDNDQDDQYDTGSEVSFFSWFWMWYCDCYFILGYWILILLPMLLCHSALMSHKHVT